MEKIIVDDITFWETKQGYYLGKVNGKAKRLHIYIWEKYNGTIPKGYVIHHIDHNKTNNDISNLEIMEKTEHLRAHALESERIILSKQNIELARIEATKWHKGENGKEWHRKHWEESLGNKFEKNIPKTCQWCGKEYFTSILMMKKSKYCCNNCRHYALMKRRKEVLYCQK